MSNAMHMLRGFSPLACVVVRGDNGGGNILRQKVPLVPLAVNLRGGKSWRCSDSQVYTKGWGRRKDICVCSEPDAPNFKLYLDSWTSHVHIPLQLGNLLNGDEPDLREHTPLI